MSATRFISGFVLAFWATPHMTFSHLLFAGGMSVYILIAIGYEERDLVDLFGPGLRGLSRQRRHADAGPRASKNARRLTD